MPQNREVTLRRTLQQAQHCLHEALSVIVAGEDVGCAHDDVVQAENLLQQVVLPELRRRRIFGSSEKEMRVLRMTPEGALCVLSDDLAEIMQHAVRTHGVDVVREALDRMEGTASASPARRPRPGDGVERAP